MARDTGRAYSLRLNLENTPSEDSRPPIVLTAFDAGRAQIFQTSFEKNLSASIPADVVKKAARIIIGPAPLQEGAAVSGKNSLVYRREQFERLLERGIIDVAAEIWQVWIPWLRCVSGHVRACRRGTWWYSDLVSAATLATCTPALSRNAVAAAPMATARLATQAGIGRLSPARSIDQLIAWPSRCFPICIGRVEVWRRICCCKPWVIFDPRIPELILDLEDIVTRLPHDPVPLPDPRPGPDPAPDGVLFREGALNERALNAAQDLRMLRALKPEQIHEYINARPYLFCFGYDCGAPVKVAEGDLGPGGLFNVCWSGFPPFLASHCHEEFAYVVRQPFGLFWLTVYNGVAAGQWYHDEDNPTLTSYSRYAYGCRNNPDGNFVFLDLIGDTGAHELITPTADSAVSVATPDYNSGLVFPAASPALALGVGLNRNWGGTLKLSVMFSEGMQGIGAKYYRVSMIEADDFGNPTGTRHFYHAGLSWNKAVPDGSGGVAIVPVSLGPVSAGTGDDQQNALYVIPYDTNPTTDWLAGQYHAEINTTDPLLDNPDARQLVTIEVFDEDGRRLRPNGTPATGLGGQETGAAFTYRRRYQATGATANVPFGALTHMFWWDNSPVSAEITDLRRNGAIFNAECLFFSGSAASTFSIGYRAYHPREQFQLYHNIYWRRGLGNTAEPQDWLEFHNPANAGAPPALPQGSTSNTFGEMLRINLQPDRTRCAFTVFLDVYNKRTDGDDLSFQHDGASAAFVLEIGS